jgi:AraC-like DNA-binding protein
MSSNEIRMWTDNALEPVSYLSADYQDFAFPPHLHDGYAIGVIERGAQRFSPGARSSLLMPEGTLCVINPGMVHSGSAGSDGGWRYRMFYPSPALVARALLEDGHEVPSFDGHVFKDDALYRQFELLHRTSQHFGDLLERESRTLMFLRALFSRHAHVHVENGRLLQPRTVALVREMLHDCNAGPLSISDLAAEAGVSETQVIRSFTAAIGVAPHAYWVALRIERAKDLIRSGQGLADVADRTGFSDQSHLSRHFKRITSLTPGQFAKALH